MILPPLPGGLLYAAAKEANKDDPHKAPLGITDTVAGLIEQYRGPADTLRASIYGAIMVGVAGAAALSCVPTESNFGSVFAGSVLRDLVSPGIRVAINAPLSDYLENIFPVRELNVRLLVSGLESGALSDAEVVETAVDSGLKDREIKKLLKIAKVKRFEKECKDDFTILDRYENALLTEQITQGRNDIDAQIADLKADLKEAQKELAALALAGGA
jgi:hypothetical protein